LILQGTFARVIIEGGLYSIAACIRGRLVIEGRFWSRKYGILKLMYPSLRVQPEIKEIICSDKAKNYNWERINILKA